MTLSLPKLWDSEAHAGRRSLSRHPHVKTGGIGLVASWKPYCDDPKPFGRYRRGTLQGPGASFDMLVPCRKCDKCRWVRSRLWTGRIERELGKHPLSWFVTLTFTGPMLSGEPDPRFRRQYRMVQLALKRLRKRSRFRFVCAFEKGDTTDRLHAHLVVHDDGLLTKREVQAVWPAHSSCKRIYEQERSHVAGYLAFYAAKSMLRVSASTHYGGCPLDP